MIVELTERDALLDVDYRIVRELHRKGVKLAIDDFGTGNSSLSWLEKLHPDVLKIDKSFTTAIGTDAVNSTVTDIIIALGQRLNIELVAEGWKPRSSHATCGVTAYIFCRGTCMRGQCRCASFRNGWRKVTLRQPVTTDTSCPYCRYAR